MTSPLEKLQADLQAIETEISLLKNAKDPYSFTFKQNTLQAKLDAQKVDFSLPRNQEELSSALISLQQDETTINTRLAQLAEERKNVSSEVQLTRDWIHRLTGQQKKAKTELRNLQNRSEALGRFVTDCKQERGTIQHNLEAKRVELVETEEQMTQRAHGLKLIYETETRLSETANQFADVQKSFLSEWENWTVQQMVCWICEQDSVYEQYRQALNFQLPQQAESGADFAFFDTNVLLGLGICPIRHRSQLMKNIAALVN